MLNSKVVCVKFLLGRLCLVMFSLVFLSPGSFAKALSGNVSVNQTSDTAANAKINAMNMARRQILTDVLSHYSDKDSFNALMQDSSNDDLMNLVSSINVSNEQMSATGYSANITINIDNDAARKWLNDHEVQNWVPLVESDERFIVSVVVPNGIKDWAELKRIARDDNIEIETQALNGNQIIVKMPLNYRTKFTAAVREAGWKYSDNAGVLQIWK